MTAISVEIVRAAIGIIGTPGIEEERIESEVRALVADDMTARRLIDWIPEAFAMVLIAHLKVGAVLPTGFSAKAANGKWPRFSFESEPVYTSAARLAEELFQQDAKELFQKVADRSSMVDTVKNALNAGVSLKGAVFSGPALIGIPAEVYGGAPVPFWRKLFGG